MLARLGDSFLPASLPVLERFCNGKKQTLRGSFPHGSLVTFRMAVPRSLGACAVVLRYARDGEDPTDLPLTFSDSSLGTDVYLCTLDTAALFPPAGGLLFYEFLFLRGEETLFTDSRNNVDFSLAPHASERFRMLVYQKDFCTPSWFHGGTMYHIFLDRFRLGKGSAKLSEGSVLDSDWENGIPQYAEKPGDPLANNVFFGGNLWGVVEKLDFLSSLGVNILYLSPVFRAASNHRYDTGSYEEIDPLLGGKEAFETLIREAHKRKMFVLLDGVFNHTGDDSLYFNKKGNYPSLGAYQSEKSPYFPWFTFREFPDDYESWWGIDILPRLDHTCEPCRRYFTAPDGIASRWTALGADGWRLDVADELSDVFLEEFRKSVKKSSRGRAVIIGEVWENAAEKISYGSRRHYLAGNQLDGVMNYPFRNAVLSLFSERNTEQFVNTLKEIYSIYPKPACDSLMNLLGTHDTERILTVLGNDEDVSSLSNRELAKKRLTSAQKRKAVKLLKIASALQYTVYGVPSLYYGDEAGLEGYHDPFCRMPYPWGRENRVLLSHYRLLGKIRQEHPALADGEFRFLFHTPETFAFERVKKGDRVVVAVHLGKKKTSFSLPGHWVDLLNGHAFENLVELFAKSFVILSEKKKGE